MDHQTIKDAIFEFYDGELPPEHEYQAAAHLQNCLECRGLLADWRRTVLIHLHPLERSPGQDFSNNVMRRIRAWKSAEDRLSAFRWRALTRWAYPILSLSMAASTIAFYYAVQPAKTGEDALLLGSGAQEVTADWKADVIGRRLPDFIEGNP